MKLRARVPGRRAAVVGMLLACAIAVPAGAASEAAVKLKTGAEDLNRVRARISEENQRIDQDRAAQSAQREAVEAAEKRIAESQRQLKKVAAEVSAQDARLRAAQASRAAAEVRLVDARERLTRQVRSAYVAGRGGSTALLLSQEEPDRIGRLLTYFDYLNRASVHNMDEINAEIAAVNAEQARVEAERAELQKLQSTRERAIVELEADRAGRKQAVAALGEKIADSGEKLKALQDSEKDIQELLGKLREALKAMPAPSKPSGSKKPYPKMRGVMAWPLRGAILANYGDTKSDSRLLWKGLWIAASEGAPVRASAAGRVAYVGWLSSYGLIVVVEHDKGFFTLYGHNSTVAAAAGEEVASGEVIAAVGNTGGYERNGLYFEVRRGTEPLDPRDWLGP